MIRLVRVQALEITKDSVLYFLILVMMLLWQLYNGECFALFHASHGCRIYASHLNETGKVELCYKKSCVLAVVSSDVRCFDVCGW